MLVCVYSFRPRWHTRVEAFLARLIEVPSVLT